MVNITNPATTILFIIFLPLQLMDQRSTRYTLTGQRGNDTIATGRAVSSQRRNAIGMAVIKNVLPEKIMV